MRASPDSVQKRAPEPSVPGNVVGDVTPLKEYSANPSPDPEEGVEAVKPVPAVNAGSSSSMLTTPRRKACCVKEVGVVETGVPRMSGTGAASEVNVGANSGNPAPVPVVAPAVVTPESS